MHSQKIGIEALTKAILQADPTPIASLPESQTKGTRIALLQALYPDGQALVLNPGNQIGVFNGETFICHPDLSAGKFTCIPGRGNNTILAGSTTDVYALIGGLRKHVASQTKC